MDRILTSSSFPRFLGPYEVFATLIFSPFEQHFRIIWQFSGFQMTFGLFSGGIIEELLSETVKIVVFPIFTVIFSFFAKI